MYLALTDTRREEFFPLDKTNTMGEKQARAVFEAARQMYEVEDGQFTCDLHDDEDDCLETFLTDKAGVKGITGGETEAPAYHVYGQSEDGHMLPFKGTQTLEEAMAATEEWKREAGTSSAFYPVE